MSISVSSTSSVPPKGTQLKTNVVNVIEVAFLLILKMQNTDSHTAVLHSKQLNSNAKSQQKANKEMANLLFDSVPKLKYKYVKYWDHHRTGVKVSLFAMPPGQASKPNALIHTQDDGLWHHIKSHAKHLFSHGPPTIHNHKQYKKTKKDLNASQIAAAQDNNMQTNGMRQVLTQKITQEQQSASILEDQVNTKANQGIQETTQASALLQLLQTLTAKALLRQPAQF